MNIFYAQILHNFAQHVLIFLYNEFIMNISVVLNHVDFNIVLKKDLFDLSET